MQIAHVNGTEIAYRVEGSGPPLVLVMGYRLSSAAWPATFVATLAREFTVITFDNRGTGHSAKPVHGYALANMARDIHGLLDVLGFARVHLLGYSMGGAIAQEFVRQFPERVTRLVLCATMCGGVRATYANAAVIRVMRDLDGLTPEQVARQIWKVTYAPSYLANNQDAAADQMRREIAWPTPLHAADLQYQAFAEFDGASALADIRCPTLVLTGDLDDLVPPQNSLMMAKRIANAKLIVLPEGGHRVLWEMTRECTQHIADFLNADCDATPIASTRQVDTSPVASAMSLMAAWPLFATTAAYHSLRDTRRAMMTAAAAHFGDGKPVILVSPLASIDLMLQPLAIWLKAIGYRPVAAGAFSFDDAARHQALSKAIRETAERVGRKAVLVTHSIGMTQALRTAQTHDKWLSDVIVLDANVQQVPNSPRTHFVSPGLFLLQSVLELPHILREIGIELIDAPKRDVGATNGSAINALAHAHTPDETSYGAAPIPTPSRQASM